MSKFIGRAEPEVKFILERILVPKAIIPQYPLQYLIPKNEFDFLDKEVQQHKFDMVVLKHNNEKIVVEVNFKHKEKAAIKWSEIFVPMLQKQGHETLAIHDYESNYLFKPQDYSKHKLTFGDFQDVINAMVTQKIK